MEHNFIEHERHDGHHDMEWGSMKEVALLSRSISLASSMQLGDWQCATQMPREALCWCL